ncbi:vWA domain-containing protein [Shinella oryzae]|uniref:von Willebrand factor type A domain-containing protein n=1 Tax=Shinella oryzae TaxID=2871820 RepID=A0ABY9K4Q7_9HYPH|nr:von Willebrand factor type A domain-containing protein [Shinella oryzae]WLS02594.1 von Willebrand factor type A domain-containing protein [Shinella oryzae]
MTDLDLEKLARRQPPAAGASARAAALAAAMQAFDDAEKNATATKGSAEGGRRSSIFNRIWSPIMNRRLLAGSALATLLVVPVAGLVTYELVRNGTVALPVEQAGDAKTRTEAQKPGAETADVQAENKKQETPAVEQADDAAALSNRERAAQATANKETSQSAADNRAGEPAPLAESLDGETAVVPQSLSVDRMLTRRVAQPAVTRDSGIMPMPQEDRERFASADPNPVKSVATDPVSTFSADVDTASYSYMRSALLGGSLPEPDSVRVEELINYFPYDWKGPETAEKPFNATVTVMPTPWNKGTELLHIGIKGFETVPAEQPSANLVFLIDVSGSMDEADKLPLLKSAFRLLVGKLKETDTVSIVTYAGNAGVVLEPTAAKERQKILDAIDALQPGGSTAGAEGIEMAYKLAQKAFKKDGVNRVMLATDGDFNVGPASDEDLTSIIEERRKSGIFLSVLGFGRGNYNDGMMQALAQNGNGTAAYIDTLAEAQKTLVEEAGSSLFPIAKDVKFQIEFNPDRIAEYRLIGYETRILNREDFNNDKVDAGDIGSGHRVTAIYEVTPKGSPAVLNDPLRYGKGETADAAAPGAGEIAFLKMRWKKPDSDTSELVTMPVTDSNVVPDLDAASADVRFSVAVAAFGQKLKGVPALQDYAYGSILGLAEAAKGNDPFGYRAEFVKLVRLAEGLAGGK